MIISKTPLRISFFSGGTDMPHFYEKELGAALSVTINKFIYVMVHKTPFVSGYRTLYDEVEEVSDIKEMNHLITKECLTHFAADNGFTISSMSDVPSKGSGLGSSSTFTVGLCNVLQRIWLYPKYWMNEEELASLACHIEMNKCGFPVGKQDQYAAAIGRLNLFEFYPKKVIKINVAENKSSTINKLNENLLLVFSGKQRSANKILQKQIESAKDKWDLMRAGRQKAYRALDFINESDLDSFGNLLHEAWMEKRQMVSEVSNDYFDYIYNSVYNAGALGGKLLGAGGGGFFLFYVQPEKQEKVVSAILNLPECKLVDFKFHYEGSKIMELDSL